MCGRFVITSAPEALRQAFGYAEQPNFPARYNIAPTQPVPVIVQDLKGRHFRLMRWGLIPSWVKDPKTFTLLINARAETVREKPAFRNALKRRRCIVPADGYYEWQPGTTPKQPYFIHRRDGAPFAFAALSETWIGPNGEEMDSVAIVTGAAEGAMAGLHGRVPVAIERADIAAWLDCALDETDHVMPLLRAPEDGVFVWYPVSTRVNKVANDDAQLLLPIEPERDTPTPAKPSRAKTPRATPPTDEQGSLF
jgi:putative SOS response-associated peptidase YedK